MLSFKQFHLREKVEFVYGTRVYVNPSVEVLENILDGMGGEAYGNHLRYIQGIKDIYVWNAYERIHSEVRDALGVDGRRGYFGKGRESWADCVGEEFDDMRGEAKRSNVPDNEDDYWQHGAWHHLPRFKKYEDMFDVKINDMKISGDVHVKSHSRSGHPVHAYSRSLPD